MSDEPVDERVILAERLYEAFDADDAATLRELLHPRFVGEVTPGLPRDWGGTYEGPETMLRECWARVFAELDARPVPEELIATGDGRLLVVGSYRGRARASGRLLDARFAHLLSFADGRIARLVQITDSARWHEALAG